MKKMHLKKCFSLKKKNKFLFFLITIFLIFFSSIYLIKKAGKKILPEMMEYAQIKTTTFGSIVITKAIEDEMKQNDDIEKLLLTEKNGDSINFDPIAINRLLNQLNTNVSKNISLLESGEIEKLHLTQDELTDYNMEELKKGIICKIPLSLFFDSFFLANLSPKIPVKLKFIGGVDTDIESNVDSYGINNAIIRVNVKVSVDAQITFPFSSKTTTVETKVPIILKVIQGEVPNIYYPQLDSSSLKKIE